MVVLNAPQLSLAFEMSPTNLHCSSYYHSIYFSVCWLYPSVFLRWENKEKRNTKREITLPHRSFWKNKWGSSMLNQHPPHFFLSQHCLQHRPLSSTKDTRGLKKNHREVYASVWMAWRLGADFLPKGLSFSWYKLAPFYWYQLRICSEASATQHFQQK